MTVSNAQCRKYFFTFSLLNSFPAEQTVQFLFRWMVLTLTPCLFAHRIAQEQCCAATGERQLCDNGVRMARQQGACERPFFQGEPWETKISKVPVVNIFNLYTSAKSHTQYNLD